MKGTNAFIVILAIVFGMVGCATPRPTITNTSSHEQSHTNLQSHHDLQHDSTYVDRRHTEKRSNDTIYIHDSIYFFKWRDRQVTDTIRDTMYINHTDTIIHTITNEIEKPIAPFVTKSCIALWVMIGVAILALIGWIMWQFSTGKVSWRGIIKWLLRSGG